MVRQNKRKRRGKLEKEDPKYNRLHLDAHNEEENSKGKCHHEVIDEIYYDVRQAVKHEVEQIDELFLAEAANENKAAHELELTNLLFEKEEAEKSRKNREDVKLFLERTKKEFYAAVTQNDQEKEEKAKRKVEQMFGEPDENTEQNGEKEKSNSILEKKNQFMNKSMYELAAEM